VSVKRGPSERSDEDLLRLMRHDPEAFEQLYRRHVARTVAFAVRRCHSAEQVHDLVAATWLEVIDASRRFDPARGRALPWILGVMANLSNDRRRRAAREHEALLRLAGQRVISEDDAVRLEEAIDAGRLARSLIEVVESMPVPEREALELVAFGTVTQDEAAAALGIAPAALRMRLSRARRRLRSAGDVGSDPEVVER
jgi:RNA polymerase sigma-70 factor (ECF subfamily)